ncbi:MAG: TonB-dependent receptor [Bacteroidia bacterium]
MNKLLPTLIILLFFGFNSSQAQTVLVFDNNTKLAINDANINIIKENYDNEAAISIKHPDYKPYNQTVNTNFKDTIHVFLVPSALKIEEVVISANKFQEDKKDIPRQIQTISKGQIQFQNRQNTADLLENTGNVFMQKSQQGGGSPVLRGFESNRILLVIDGVRMNNAIYRGGHLQNVLRIDQNILNRAEVLFGGGSTIYGSDALGGVLYFETILPKIKTNNYNAYYRFGSVNNESTIHFDVNIGKKKWAHLISFTNSNFGDLRQGTNKENIDGDSIYQRNYYAARVNNRDTMLKNSDPSLQLGTAYNQFDIVYKALYARRSTEQHVFNFQLSNTNNVPRYDRLNEWKGTKNYRSAEWYYGPELRTLASYQYRRLTKSAFVDYYKMNVAYQYIEESRYDRNWQAANLNQRNEFLHVASLNIDATKQIRHFPKMKHEFRYGFDGQFNYVASNANAKNVITGITSSNSSRYPDGGSTMSYLAAYFSHSLEIGKKIIVSDGLRVNYVELNSTFNNKSFFPFLANNLTQQNSAINGNIGLVYLPIKAIKLYTNMSTAFRAPNLDDVNKVFDSKSGEAIITPNPELKPEYTYNYELGFSAVAHKKIKLEGNVYFTQIDNAITIKATTLNGSDSALYNGVNTKVFSNQNAQQAYIYGYNAQLAVDITSNFMAFSSINYTYGRIKNTDNETPLDHIPPMFGRSALQFHKNKLMVEFSSVYNGWKHIEDFNLTGEDNAVYATPKGSPAWYTLNLKAQYSFGTKGKIQLQTGIDNITDTQYRVFASGVSAAGRNIWACLRLRM